MTAAGIQQIIELFDKGLTYGKIASKLDLCQNTVGQYVNLKKRYDKGEKPDDVKDSTSYSKKAWLEWAEKFGNNYETIVENPEAKKTDRRMKYKIEVIIWEYPEEVKA